MSNLRPDAAFEQAYDRLVQLEMRQLSICSINRHSGSSVLALALAKRAAETGKRVLLIDFNTVYPGLHLLTELERNEWLPLTGHWEHSVQPTEIPGLNLLTCPEKTSHCIEFHDPETLKLFLQSCRQQYDMVICDTVSLHENSADTIPAEVVAACSQATVLNILAGVTTESHLDDARQTLISCGALLIGAVLNDRFNPNLKKELLRETHRLDRWFPRLMKILRDWLEHRVLLSQDI